MPVFFLSTLRRCCALLLCGWLAGCALHPAQVNGKPDLALQHQLKTLQHWTINGKLAVRSTDIAESAHVQWQQNNDQFDIRLSGPAGLKATRIYGTPTDAYFEQGDKQIHADSIEALSEQVIGWPLPASELMWWLRGLPAPNTSLQAATYNTQGVLTYLLQDGWRIHFSEHFSEQQPSSSGLLMPGRIEASRDQWRITLIIKTWQTN